MAGQDGRGSLGGWWKGAGLGSHSSWGSCGASRVGLVGQVQLVFCSCVAVKIHVGLMILTVPHRDKSLLL